MPRVGIRVTTSSSLKKAKIHPAIIFASVDEIGDYSTKDDDRSVQTCETQRLKMAQRQKWWKITPVPKHFADSGADARRWANLKARDEVDDDIQPLASQRF